MVVYLRGCEDVLCRYVRYLSHHLCVHELGVVLCQYAHYLSTTVHAHPKSAADSEKTVTCQGAGSAGDPSALCAEARLLALSHHNMIAPSKVKHKSHEAQNNLSSTLSPSLLCL